MHQYNPTHTRLGNREAHLAHYSPTRNNETFARRRNSFTDNTSEMFQSPVDQASDNSPVLREIIRAFQARDHPFGTQFRLFLPLS